MYDIKIFLENNGEVGARLKVGKDIIYTTGTNYNNLIQNLKKEAEFLFDGKKMDSNNPKLYNFFNADEKTICR